MARVRKVPLVKGEKRITYKGNDLAVVQSEFCGECNSLTQSVTIQIGKATAERKNISRVLKVGRACTNTEGHKDGKKYLWPDEGWIIPRK